MTTLLAFDYVRLVLKEEFYDCYIRFRKDGALRYELTNLLELCAPLMEGLDEDDRFLRCELADLITRYLEES